MNVSIIMYHYVRDLKRSRYPNIRGLDLAQFRQQIDYLGTKGQFVSMAQVIASAQGEGKLPKNPILLTFDDGYIDHYTNVFPLLMQKGIPAFFSMPGKILAEGKVLDVNKIHFILASTELSVLLPRVFHQLNIHRKDGYDYPSNQTLYEKLATANRFDNADTIFIKRLLQVELPETLRNTITDALFEESVGMEESAFARELYMSREQVELMQRNGMEWGLHGYEHYWMNRLSEAALIDDIHRALQVFEGIVPRNRWVFCYPYGSLSPDVIRVSASCGACAGLSTIATQAVLGNDSIFALPRFDTNDFPPKSESFLEKMQWA